MKPRDIKILNTLLEAHKLEMTPAQHALVTFQFAKGLLDALERYPEDGHKNVKVGLRAVNKMIKHLTTPNDCPI